MASSTQYVLIVGLLGLMLAFVSLTTVIGQLREQIRDFLYSSSYMITEIAATTMNNVIAFPEDSVSVVHLPHGFECTVQFRENYIETKSKFGTTESYYGLFLLGKIEGLNRDVRCKDSTKVIITKTAGKISVEGAS